MKSPPLTLELVPLDGASPQANAPGPVSPPATPEIIEVPTVDKAAHGDVQGAAPGADRFAREAAQQYAEGHIDQPLWDRALAQANGDPDAAVDKYLKARATALRLLDRELRQEQRARLHASDRRPSPSPSAARPPPPDAGLVEEDDEVVLPAAASPRFGQKRLLGKYRGALIAAGVAVPVIAAAVWLTFGRSAPPPVAPAARPAAAVAAKPAAPVAAKVADAQAVNAEFMQKLQQFRDAGNWNMVVLYSVEWTRRAPANAAAWNELRAGYVNLRQYDDALAAARKAVDLAPADGAYWRHLGNAELDVDDPAKALAAFTEAVARDPADVYSMQQMGLLHARAGRMPEAKSAFDLALLAQPGDPLTTCLRNGVGQLAPQKEPHAALLQVRTVDARCHGTESPAEPAAAAAAPQRPGPAQAAKRSQPR